MKDIKYIRDALRWVLNIPGFILAISGVVWVGVVILSFVVIAMLYRRVVQRKSWREAWDLAWRDFDDEQDER